MPSVAALKRLHQLIWMLIYGGLLTVVLGVSVLRTEALGGWILLGCGAVATVLGAVLIYVRSTFADDPAKVEPKGLQ